MGLQVMTAQQKAQQKRRCQSGLISKMETMHKDSNEPGAVSNAYPDTHMHIRSKAYGGHGSAPKAYTTHTMQVPDGAAAIAAAHLKHINRRPT
jgi:hypothetical protein